MPNIGPEEPNLSISFSKEVIDLLFPNFDTALVRAIFPSLDPSVKVSVERSGTPDGIEGSVRVTFKFWGPENTVVRPFAGSLSTKQGLSRVAPVYLGAPGKVSTLTVQAPEGSVQGTNGP